MTDDNDIYVPQIEKGTYQHYKGKQYEVIGVALNSETLEPCVVYRPLYATSADLWVRPYAMFVETAIFNGIEQPRFKKVDNT